MIDGKALESKILYEKDFPVRISLETVTNYPLHFHLDLEIIYVLRGSVHLKNGSCLYELTAQSIFTCNKNEVHGLFRGSPDNIVAIFHVQSDAMVPGFPELCLRGGSCFRTLGEDPDNPAYVHLQKNLLLCVYYWIKKTFGYKSTITTIVEELLPYLNDHFNHWSYNEKRELYWQERTGLEGERLRNVIRYVYANYDKKLTLDDLGYQLGLDSYYLSHLIKKDLGISFRDLVFFARVEMADQLLLGTDLSISEIRKRVAISTLDYFEKHFVKWYRCSPEEYRAKYKPHTILHAVPQGEFANQQETLVLVKERARLLGFLLPKALSISESIDISLTQAGEPVCLCRPQLWIDGGWTAFEKMNWLRRHKPASQMLEGQAVPANYLWDTVAAPIFLLGEALCARPDKPAANWNHFQDRWTSRGILQGQRGVFTSTGIVKPVYFAYPLLERLDGELLYFDFKTFACYDRETETISILLTHFDQAILADLHREQVSWQEAAKRLNGFDREREVFLRLTEVPPGRYRLRQLAMSHSHSLFAYLDQCGRISQTLTQEEEELAAYFAAPDMKITQCEVGDTFSQRIHLEGTAFCWIELKKTK